MGFGQSKQQSYQSALNSWKCTLAAIDAYEAAERAKSLPGTCRLIVYWMQMVLCLAELFVHVGYHCVAIVLLLLPIALADCYMQAKGMKPDGGTDQDSATDKPSRIVTPRDADREPGDFLRWPFFPQTQYAFHQCWLNIYINGFLQVINFNILNPKEPLYLFCPDVSVIRPSKPQPPAPDCCDCTCGDCQPKISCNCQDLCCPSQDTTCDCADNCCAEFMRLLEMILRYLKASFFVLGGFDCLHPGSCLGPLAAAAFYQPCVQDPENPGCVCQFCEDDIHRMKHWSDAAWQEKVQRSIQFYDARPDLRRPSASTLRVASQTKANSLTAPLLEQPVQQQAPGEIGKKPPAHSPRLGNNEEDANPCLCF